MSMDPENLTLFLTYFVALMACALDLSGKGIPSWLTLPSITAGLGVALASGGLQLSGLAAILMDPNLPPSLTHVMINGLLALAFFGWAVLRGGMAKGDFLLILALGCLNRFFPFVTLLMYTALCGFVLAIVHVLRKGLGGEALKALGRTLLLRSRERLADGSLARVHTLSMPYTPAVLLGVLLSAAGRGW